jgi:TRAP-type C4-dicarboxylate transport system substrate-binding protein
LRYASSLPAYQSQAALIISDQFLSKLEPEWQNMVKDEFSSVSERISAECQTNDSRAYKTMQKAGIQFIAFPDTVKAEMARTAEIMRANLAGSVYPKTLLKTVTSAAR